MNYSRTPHGFGDEDSGSPRRPYHRHCHACGWGFTRHVWATASFCTRCGTSLKSAAPGHSLSPGRAEVLPPSVAIGGSFIMDSGKASVFSRIASWLRDHPLLASASLVAAGVGLVIAGPVLAVTGAALAALGGSLIGITTTIGLVAAVLGVICGEFALVGGGLVVAAAGSVIGAALSLIGSVIAAAGAFVTGVGWVILAVCLLLVLRRVGREAWIHREQIGGLVAYIRSGARRTALTEGQTATPQEEGPLTVEQLLAAIDSSLKEQKPR